MTELVMNMDYKRGALLTLMMIGVVIAARAVSWVIIKYAEFLDQLADKWGSIVLYVGWGTIIVVGYFFVASWLAAHPWPYLGDYE